MEEICVLVAESTRKGIKRYTYQRKNIPEFNIVLDIYTIFRPSSLFTARRIKKICSKYRYVYSKDFCFLKYCKKNEEPLLNFLPCFCLTKIANSHRIKLTEENIGIVIRSKKFVNIKFLTDLCKNLKYIRIYGSDKDTDNMFMEASGICVQPGKDNNEKMTVYLDNNIYFKVDNKIITDIKLHIPGQFKENIPFEEIISDLLKCENSEKLMKKLKLNIKEFVLLDKTM